VAQQTTTTLVDDLDDNVTAEETIRFGLDGTEYEIDLSAENAASLREDLATWVDHARRTGGRRRKSPTGTRDPARPSQRIAGRTPANREHTAAVRDWARHNGYDVSSRGRIPTAVQEAFDAVH